MSLSNKTTFFLFAILQVSALCKPHFPTVNEVTRISSNRTPRAENITKQISKFRRAAPICGQFCKFSLCQTNGTTGELMQLPLSPFTLLGLPGHAGHAFICRSSEGQLDLVTESGEARVFDHNSYVPISLWRPTGLSHPFAKDFVGSFKNAHHYVSGVGTSASPIGNQWRYLHDRCMILPINRYFVRTPEGIQERSTEGEQNSCVAVRTTAPELTFQLIWDTTDDFDVLVEEPDGYIIDHFSPLSTGAKLNHDNGKKLCLSNLSGVNENILFFPGYLQSGQYSVDVTHHTKCTTEPTYWTLKVLQNGIQKAFWHGISKSPSVVLQETFNVTTV